MQLGIAADPSRAWIFANTLRGREDWILPPAGLEPSEAEALAATVPLDGDGFPRALPEGCRVMIQASCETGRALDPSSAKLQKTCLRGAFVLTWEGRGSLRLDSSHADGRDEWLLLNAPNRIVLVLDTPFKGLVVQLLSTDPSDPVRHLRLWPPAWDGAGMELTADSPLGPGEILGNLEPAPGEPEPLFHPLYLQHLAECPDAGVLRTIGLLGINGLSDPTPITWEDRGHATGITGSLSVVDRTWGLHAVPAFRARAGVAYEWLIELCNQAHRDLWLNLPHTASPDLVENLAALVARRLDPDLRVWVEFSNELWNSATPYLPQHELAKDRNAERIEIDALGMGASDLERYRRMFSRSQGLILITGPTGSGKTSTLYGTLHELNSICRNIVTVEDPVELYLPGITQVQVNVRAGVTFASALRCILRQDPNVIMVGEIRDAETAEIAFQSAQTGHMVLSTVHTNSAAATLVRLSQIGIPGYLVGDCLLGVVAQRLVRRLCGRCRREAEPDTRNLAYLARAGLTSLPDRTWTAEGCEDCGGTGFRGRMGLFEVVAVTPALKEGILAGRPEQELARISRDDGSRSLLEDGLSRVQAGETSLEEVLRIVAVDPVGEERRCLGICDFARRFPRVARPRLQ